MDTPETLSLKISMETLENSSEIKKNGDRRSRSSLYANIRPMFFLIRFIGLAPYEFDDANDQLTSSSKYIILSFFWLIIYTYASQKNIYEFYHHLVTTKKHVYIGMYLSLGMMTMNHASAIFDIVHNLVVRKKLINVWNSLQDYDKAVKDIGYTKNESNTLLWVWSVIVVEFLIWFSIILSSIYTIDKSWFSILCSVIIYIGLTMSATKFSGLEMMLGQRFHHLNGIVKECISNGKSWAYTRTGCDAIKIERLHNNLVVAADNLQSIYSWPMLIWIGNLILRIVRASHFVLIETSSMDVYSVELWIVNFIWQLWILCASCDYASREGNDMRYILIEWKRWLHNHNEQQETIPSFYTMLNMKLSFIAAGCFKVDLRLLTAITSLITTFLVILMQLD